MKELEEPVKNRSVRTIYKRQFQRIDEKFERKVRLYSNRSPDEISMEISRLEQEWDLERVIGLSSAGFTILGLILGRRRRRWLFYSGVMASFLAQHALKGWSPPASVFSSFGLRSRKEIEREILALKAVRGDFDRMGYANQNNEILVDVVKEAVLKDD